MNFLSKVTAIPKLPERIKGLKVLSKNMWWTWNYDSQKLFEIIDLDLWISTNRNPVVFLKNVSQKKLDSVLNDEEFLNLYDYVMKTFENYMNTDDTWFNKTHKNYKGGEIAYFCAEYGIHESLPIYSGGLGILAGDHVKSASDIGIPYIGVGFLYRQGYFQQKINNEGWQESIYESYDFADLAVDPAKDKNGEEVYVDIDIAGKKVFVKVWELKVGRVKVYLLDTDIPQNDPDERWLTSRLYGGDQEMRIRQEMLLGIAGVRALRKLDINPSVWHMNEGHAAFLNLERMRELIQSNNLTFKEAIEVVRAGSIFTTHTPVPAGNDAFPLYLMDKYFGNYWPTLKATRPEFMQLGLEARPDGSEMFSMTILALSLAGRANGVSKLHGEVSRNLWKHVWNGIEAVEVPITHVTNGVHSETWIADDLQKLFKEEFGENWNNEIDDPDMWAKIEKISDKELWEKHQKLKLKLINHLHERLKTQRSRHGETVEELESIEDILDPKALTIGFARRFATYKRAILIFRDLQRLEKILNNPERPVQIIFAGKAHPADKPGQEFIKRIYEISRMEQFKNRIVIVENYDMNLARHLVSGVDIWLNNPRRPHEASGTSGEKAGMNGAMNFSVLDGWWVEGYNKKNGWAIGDNRDYTDLELQDNIDSVSMYNTLEKEIVPMYYDNRKEDIPVNWIKVMKESIRSVASFFNTSRMVKEYTQKLYMPAQVQNNKFVKDNFEVAKDFANWRDILERNWNSIKIKVTSNQDFSETLEVGKIIEIESEIYLPGIGPDSIEPEIVVAKLEDDKVISLKTYDLKMIKEIQQDTYLYRGSFEIEDRGQYGYNVRVSASHPYMPHRNYLMNLVKYPM
ncbi:alpha-glucan phosphorylase [Tepiditoga spiralis]|uniref:Alpha-glucan phosphorylase n=1 Tax=Tepiditoga spiralis TaxID=2108365 RepID=A0A7G1GBE4_9BACT|nr:alpha-glucan family phosphorylase [Tepiditoga spiralis]BBE31019.1 alpha-glucan phosphorylase [Tepiditoga spiralis]